MKNDLEILVLGLMLLKIITSARVTKRTTLNLRQLDVLSMDAKALYMLAYYRTEEHNQSDKKYPLGDKFFFLYMVLTRIPYVVRHPDKVANGLYCPIGDSNEFWKRNGVFLFTGFNKQDGMTYLEKKRVKTHRIFSLFLLMCHAPKGLNLKNSEAHLDRLMTSVFEFAMGDHQDESDDKLKDLRHTAIKTIYRMVDFIQQMATSVNHKGESVVNSDNIAHVMDRPDYSQITTLAHNMEVRLLRHVAETKIHRVFNKQYK